MKEAFTIGIMFLLALPMHAHADGFPYRDGHIIGDSAIISLSVPQCLQAQLLGYVSLNSTQTDDLKPRKAARIRTIGIWRHVDAKTYDGCTCGLANLGVLSSPRQLDVPHSLLSGDSKATPGSSFLIQYALYSLCLVGCPAGWFVIRRRRRRTTASSLPPTSGGS